MENKRSSIVRGTINRRKHRTLATIGFVIIALAVVGLVTVIISSIRVTGNILDNTKEKQKLEHFILPLIMFDPLTFDSPQNADPQQLLKTSLWSVLLSRDREEFVKDDMGMILLPKSDVDVQAAKLFGADVKLQHQTFGSDYDVKYVYDEQKETYRVPVSYQMAAYTPKILEITHEGDLYTLLVGYIPPGNLWQTDAEGNTYEPEPDKSMYLDLKKVKSGYNIVALRDGPDSRGQGGSQAVDENGLPIGPPDSQPDLEDDYFDDLTSSDAVSDDETTSSEPSSSGEEPPQESSSDASSSAADLGEGNTPPEFDRVSASSFAPEGLYHSYGPENVLDGDLGTTWTEGKEDDGIGEWLLFEADEAQRVSGIRMTNGYTRNETLYQQNNRITKIRLEFSDGTSVEKELTGFTDSAAGEITLDEPVVTTSVKITILAVDQGNTYRDTCITVVEFV